MKAKVALVARLMEEPSLFGLKEMVTVNPPGWSARRHMLLSDTQGHSVSRWPTLTLTLAIATETSQSVTRFIKKIDRVTRQRQIFVRILAS